MRASIASNPGSRASPMPPSPIQIAAGVALFGAGGVAGTALSATGDLGGGLVAGRGQRGSGDAAGAEEGDAGGDLDG